MGAISRHIARRYLSRVSREHIQEFPQLACFSFDLITNIIMLEGQYERDQLEFLASRVFPNLPEGGACVDVGANIGNHSVFFARHFKQVISLEPHPRNFELLSINAGLADNIVPLKIGASNAPNVLEIKEDLMNLAASSLHHTAGRTGNSVEIRVERIDDMAEVQEAEGISFMKFDIEGHEALAIEGAKETIKRHRPIIMLEILKDEIAQGTSASIDALKELGYSHFHEPVEAGWLGKLPRRRKKFARAIWELFTGRPLSKAERVVRVDQLENRNYLLVLCAADPPPYA